MSLSGKKMEHNTVYGYCRVSTKNQKLKRQVENIKRYFPQAIIITEKYTGTKMNEREEFKNLISRVTEGDIIVFDEVSRMSCNADDGTNLYIDLYDRGINLIFLKNPNLNTDIFRKNGMMCKMNENAQIIDKDSALRELARMNARIAFEQIEKNVRDLQEMTREGIREARKQGKQIGQRKGIKIITKKEIEMREKIKKMSKDFDGNMTDKEVMKILDISRNTYYKYKKRLRS